MYASLTWPAGNARLLTYVGQLSDKESREFVGDMVMFGAKRLSVHEEARMKASTTSQELLAILQDGSQRLQHFASLMIPLDFDTQYQSEKYVDVVREAPVIVCSEYRAMDGTPRWIGYLADRAGRSTLKFESRFCTDPTPEWMWLSDYCKGHPECWPRWQWEDRDAKSYADWLTHWLAAPEDKKPVPGRFGRWLDIRADAERWKAFCASQKRKKRSRAQGEEGEEGEEEKTESQEGGEGDGRAPAQRARLEASTTTTKTSRLS